VFLSLSSWKKVVERGNLVASFATWEEDRVSTAALWWERHVRLGREDGATLAPDLYLELRYEALVADPPGECQRLCAFLGSSLRRVDAALSRSCGRTQLTTCPPSAHSRTAELGRAGAHRGRRALRGCGRQAARRAQLPTLVSQAVEERA
jgi:hypothetical protein